MILHVSSIRQNPYKYCVKILLQWKPTCLRLANLHKFSISWYRLMLVYCNCWIWPIFADVPSLKTHQTIENPLAITKPTIFFRRAWNLHYFVGHPSIHSPQRRMSWRGLWAISPAPAPRLEVLERGTVGRFGGQFFGCDSLSRLLLRHRNLKLMMEHIVQHQTTGQPKSPWKCALPNPKIVITVKPLFTV